MERLAIVFLTFHFSRRFYQHFFSIFFFAPLSNSLMDHATLWSASEPYLFSLTWMWFNVIGNLITQVFLVCLFG